MDRETINKIKQSKNILSNVTKVEQDNGNNGLKQFSTPFSNFAQCNLRSEMFSTPDQTTLNLSTNQIQNGTYSATFNSGINSSIQHSKQNLETVRDYYFQSGAQKQNVNHANIQSQKINMPQQDTNNFSSNRKVNIVPPLKLSQIQSQQNQIYSVESFDIGSSPQTSQTKQIQNISNNLQILQYANIERNSSSSQKARSKDNNMVKNVIVNGFLTERTVSSNSKRNLISAQSETPSKGILKQTVKRQRKSINIERNNEFEQQVQYLINYEENKVINSNFININKRQSLKQDNTMQDLKLDQSLEFNSLTERRFSQKQQTYQAYQVQKNMQQNQEGRKSKENVINGYFSPITSMNNLNITDLAQQQSCVSLSNIKSTQPLRLNVKTLSNQGIENLSSQQQSQNNIPAKNKQIFKRKNNQIQLNKENEQQYQLENQNQILINNKQQIIPTISINNSPYLYDNTTQRENLNLNTKTQKNIQQSKSPQNKVIFGQIQQNSLSQVNSIFNEISSLANIEQNMLTVNDQKNDQFGVKCRTEGDLFKQAIKQKASNVNTPLNQQFTITQIGKSDSISQKFFGQRSIHTKPLSLSPQKKHQNNFVTAIKFQQKQTERLNFMSEFIKQQKQISEKNKAQFSGLSFQKQGEIIQFWNYLKTRLYAKNSIELVFKKNRFDEKAIKVFINVVDRITDLCQKEIHNPSNYNKISDLFHELIKIISQLKIISSFFLIRFYSILGKFAYKCGNIYNSVKAFIEAKRLATINKEYKIKMRIHKHIGHCFKLLKKFSEAKNQFIKMLTLSWVLNDKDAELASYEELGIIFYYECEIGIATRLHQRSCLDITEDHMSKARQSAIENFKQRQRFSDQQKNIDDLDQKEQQSEQIKIKINKKPAKSLIKEPSDIEQVDFEDSSDEEADYYVREIIQREVMKEEETQQDKMNQEKNEATIKNIKLRYSKQMQERQRIKEEEQTYQRIIGTQQFSENSENEKKKYPQILISHLSKNRNLNNYIETSLKEHQYFQLKKFQENLKNKIGHQDDNIANLLINQLKQRSSVLQVQIDEKSPTSQIAQQYIQTKPDEIEQNQTLFKFTVPHSAFKDVTTSLEKIRKQILLLFNNVEMYESQKNNLKSVSRKNALLFS